jgi:hypothetical protein
MLLKLIWSPIHYVRQAIDSRVAGSLEWDATKGVVQLTRQLNTKTSAEGLAYFRHRMHE